MERPIGLWIFSVLGIVTNIISGGMLFMGFIMPAQIYHFWKQFISVTLLLLLLFIISIIGLFRLKKWGRNIFIILTLVMNSFLIWLFSSIFLRNINIIFIVFLIDIIFIVFIFSFLVYFLHPSVRRLFK